MGVVFIAAHQGLGDHIVCNAIYRNYASRARICLIPCTTHYYSQVREMLGDVKNVVLIPIFSNYTFFQTRWLIKIMQFIRIRVIRLGYFGTDFKNDEKFTDQSFYEQAQIDWRSRWQDFYIPYNLDKAVSLFTKLGLSGSKYILVHEDESRGMKIRKEYLSNQYTVVRLEHRPGYHIFDYTKVIEEAVEIHCIESSFAHFIDSISGGPKSLFLHTYARPTVREQKSNQITYKRKWNII